MQRLRFFMLSLFIGLILAGGATFASTVWQGTAWMTNGSTISAQKIKANFDYLFERVGSNSMPVCVGKNKALQWDGSVWLCSTVVVVKRGCTQPDIQVFSRSATWTKPPCAQTVKVACWGGGGGGASGASGLGHFSTGNGGGGGGYRSDIFPASSVLATVAIRVGAGGRGAGASTAGFRYPGIAWGANGSAGTDSTFGTLLRAGGGAGGQSNDTGYRGVSIPNSHARGGSGSELGGKGGSDNLTNSANTSGGGSTYTSGAGGAASQVYPNGANTRSVTGVGTPGGTAPLGGVSNIGGNGGNGGNLYAYGRRKTWIAARNGVAPGGGGGGAPAGRTPGNGARGQCIITAY